MAKKKKNTTWVEACLQNTNDKFAIFQTPDDHKCVRSEETSIFTCVFKHFVGDNNSDQSALTAVVIYIKTYFNIRGNSFGYFSQLSIYDISEKKKLKNQYIENDELYRISFLSWAMTLENSWRHPRWRPSWQPPFWNPFQDKKLGFILAAIVSEFDLKRPNDSEDFPKYFIELT